MVYSMIAIWYIDGLVQDYNISSMLALAMEILQSCTKRLIYQIINSPNTPGISAWQSSYLTIWLYDSTIVLT